MPYQNYVENLVKGLLIALCASIGALKCMYTYFAQLQSIYQIRAVVCNVYVHVGTYFHFLQCCDRAADAVGFCPGMRYLIYALQGRAYPFCPYLETVSQTPRTLVRRRCGQVVLPLTVHLRIEECIIHHQIQNQIPVHLTLWQISVQKSVIRAQ